MPGEKPRSTGACYVVENPPKTMASKHDLAVLNSIFNPLQPLGESFIDESTDSGDEEIETEEIKEAKMLEVIGVKNAETGKIEDAIQIFTDVIRIAPTRPSGYNNRAQAFRLLGNDTEAMVDLNNAINLSQGKCKAARQALCQRGMIHRRQGRDCEAKLDFEAAAKLGSEFAKSQIVEMNPYAALCNKMLHDVFSKLQKGDLE